MSNYNHLTSTYTTLEVNKGRTEWRSVSVSDHTEGVGKGWVGLRQFIKVHRHTKTVKGWQQAETAYFISSLRTNAMDYMEGIRQHWGIENSLHWVKDVVMKEDNSRIRTGQAPQNLSIIKNMSINLLRNKVDKSLTRAIRLIANDIPAMNDLLF